MIFSKYPPNEITQQLLQDQGFGAVISGWSGKIYGTDLDDQPEPAGTGITVEVVDAGAEVTNGDFAFTDDLVSSAISRGLITHVHPIWCRYTRNGGQGYQLLNHDQGMAIVERYVTQGITKFTLANELLTAPEPYWSMIVRFYREAARLYPDIELWVGDYGIYDQPRQISLLNRLSVLKQAVPTLHGFIGQDYVDLDNSSDRIARFIKVGVLSSIPLARFLYLNSFIDRVKKLGLEFSLETSVFCNEDNEWNRYAQASIYNCLATACRKSGANLWLWEACNASAKYFHDTERVVYPGVWDAQGEKRLDVDL